MASIFEIEEAPHGECPFKCHLVPIPNALDPRQIELKQVIMACSGEKCQLWNEEYSRCAFSLIPATVLNIKDMSGK